MNAPVKIETTLKDWETDQEVRWCPAAVGDDQFEPMPLKKCE